MLYCMKCSCFTSMAALECDPTALLYNKLYNWMAAGNCHYLYLTELYIYSSYSHQDIPDGK